jgi:nucleotide-binding universal stress UspA family protein
MLTERLQRAAIWQLSQGKQPANRIQPEKFAEPWRTIYLLLERRLANPVEDSEETPLEWAVSSANIVPASLYDYWDKVDEVVSKIEAAERDMKLHTLGDVAERYPPVQWLWEGWLPRSMLTLLAAKPGAGKTHWILDLVRTLQQGGVWPDGQAVTDRGPVVWIEGEGIPQEIEERAVAMGINTRKDFYIIVAPDGELIDLSTSEWGNVVVDTVAAAKPALVVVDSLSTVTPNGQDRSEQVTPLLLWLVSLARWSGASVVLVHHLKKSNSSGQLSFPLVTMDDIRGSGQIAAQARSILAISMMGQGLAAPRRLEVLKKTISRGRTPKPMGVNAMKDGGDLVVRFEYVEAPTAEGAPSRDNCSAWLLELLENAGPMRFKDISAAGKEEGFTDAMIWRTRKSLGAEIIDTKGKQNPKNEWALANTGADFEDTDADDLL